jgi:hypothetical protein
VLKAEINHDQRSFIYYEEVCTIRKMSLFKLKISYSWQNLIILFQIFVILFFLQIFIMQNFIISYAKFRYFRGIFFVSDAKFHPSNFRNIFFPHIESRYRTKPFYLVKPNFFGKIIIFK